jgi:LysR family glycine cleavage system transcriptional activator
VRLETSLKPVDFVAQQVDIGVRYGAGVWPGWWPSACWARRSTPSAPRPCWRAGPLSRPADLLEQTLIHDLSMEGHPGFPSWADWLRQAGLDGATGRRAIQINNSAAVLQAAAEGQGIALARSVMARDDLQAGRLVRLCPQIRLPSRLAYHVVYRPECAGQPMIQAFRDWLMAEAAAWQAAAAPAGEPPQEPTA